MHDPRIASVAGPNFAALMIAAILFAALSAIQTAQAQPKQAPAPKQKRSERVSIMGCPYAGVTATCLMIRSPDGTVYNITAAAPRPRRSERMIRVRGLVTSKASICGEGIVLDRIRWTRTRQRCPN